MIERDTTEEARAVPALSGGVLAPVAGSARWVTRFCRTKPLGAIGGAITLLLILIALAAPLLAPYGAKETLGVDLVHQPPSFAHPMGTDHVGRDLMSRIIYGTQISLVVGFGSVLVGITVGFVLAITTTYAGSYVDLSFQRLIDAMTALPG